LLAESDDYVLVCHQSEYIKPLRDELRKLDVWFVVAQRKIISPRSQMPTGKKLITEEFLGDLKKYHSIVLTLTKDLVVYDANGRKRRFEKEQIYRK
jgi:hypothetical protein